MVDRIRSRLYRSLCPIADETGVMRDRTAEIRRLIERVVSSGDPDLVRVVSSTFNMSRQAVHKHLHDMVRAGVIERVGEPPNRKYQLVSLAQVRQTLQRAGLEEDVVWRDLVQPVVRGVARNEEVICHYGFTEMLNNAIDHSEGTEITVEAVRTVTSIRLRIGDNGVGIFQKIKRDLHLDHERHAILELAKGKLTTDPANHTGLGIFFTSRSLDEFHIFASGLFFKHFCDDTDWLLDSRGNRPGTHVEMILTLPSKRDLESVFSQFSGQHTLGFGKTIVPVQLAQYGEDNLVSRSQAKRLLTRFDRFEEVVLDFHEVEIIGQAFADEIFRVFQRTHPNVRITHINANPSVERMIQLAHAMAAETAGTAPVNLGQLPLSLEAPATAGAGGHA